MRAFTLTCRRPRDNFKSFLCDFYYQFVQMFTLFIIIFQRGQEVAQFVEALRYKLEGRCSIPDGVIRTIH